MDYWAGTFGLVVFALMETILFMWVFGADKAFEEINSGGDIKIPVIFKYIMKYVTPLILLTIMIWWLINDAIPTLLLQNLKPEDYHKVPYIWGARVMMLIILGLIMFLIHIAWKNREMDKNLGVK